MISRIRSILFTCLCILSMPSFSRGIDITTKDGRVFKNAEVFKKESDRITITYPKGAVTLRFSELTDDLRKKLGYDSEKAERAKEERLRAERAAQAQSRQATMARQNAMTTGDEGRETVPIEQQRARDAATIASGITEITNELFPEYGFNAKTVPSDDGDSGYGFLVASGVPVFSASRRDAFLHFLFASVSAVGVKTRDNSMKFSRLVLLSPDDRYSGYQIPISQCQEIEQLGRVGRVPFRSICGEIEGRMQPFHVDEDGNEIAPGTYGGRRNP